MITDQADINKAVVISKADTSKADISREITNKEATNRITINKVAVIHKLVDINKVEPVERTSLITVVRVISKPVTLPILTIPHRNSKLLMVRIHQAIMDRIILVVILVLTHME